MQVVALQERSSALLSELEEARASVAKQRAEAAVAAGLGPGGAVGGAAGVGMSKADKELLLRQIESLKEVCVVQIMGAPPDLISIDYGPHPLSSCM
jgi:hypothetical protein